MSITDELRGWMKGTTLSSWTAEHLTAIADRIDAEHERECKEQYACGVEHGIGASIDASMIQTHGYVELPKDADGVPWHIGDRTESGQTVEAMSLNRKGWCFIGTVNEIDPSIHRHYQPDTWEKIIEDAMHCDQLLEEYDPDASADVLNTLVARCKALAGDADATHGRQSDADLAAENAKLRWLVEDMLSCIEIQIAFDRTPEKWMYKEFAGRAQELGVEEEKDG